MKTILNIILTPFKMIWGIFDNDAHRIMSKKGLNFVEISVKLDKQLAKETTESLTEWIESKRKTELFYQKQAMNPYPTESQSHTAYEKGFIEGWEKCQKNDDAECVNCDEVKETHQICMDCIGKLIKENQETFYTEEEVREGIRMCFAETSAGNLITIDDVIRYIKSLKQK